MGWQHTAFVYPTLLGLLVALVLGGFTARHLRAHGTDPVRVLFLAIMFALALWTGFSALKLLQTDPALKLLFYRLLYFGVTPMGPLLVLFALAYTDRTQWLRPSVVLGLSVLPVTYLLALFVDPGGLAIQSTRFMEVGGVAVLRVETGPLHVLVMVLYTSVLGLAAVGIIGYEAVHLGRAYLPQAALLTVAILVAMVFGLLTEFGVPPFDREGVNLVPASAAISASALGLATFRYRWFDLPPIAYTTVVEDAPYGVFVADPDERIVHANARAERLLERLGATVNDRVENVFPAVDPWTEGDTVVDIGEDGGDHRILEVKSRVIERYGTQVGAVLVSHDVTDQRKRRRELRAQKQRLDEFASVVSHDLRSPLSVASGRLAQLRGECDDEVLDRIERAHERMEVLIADLLTLARDGTVIAEPGRVSLGDLVDECWETTPAEAATLQVELDSESVIVADESRLRQLLENLFRNAVDHGGADVTVTVGTLDEGFYVADDGPGIPEDSREAVLEGGYSTTDGGTGIGLTIVERIASAHGWSLRIRTADSGGARFEITGVQFGQA